jgi:hypothetical protein
MSRGLAFRRHQEKKHKERARKKSYEIFRNPPTPKQIGILAHTPKMCSCWMCGNQRQHFGDTITDIRNKNKFSLENFD